MARVQNVSGEDLFVPLVGRVVEADEVFEVDDDSYEAFVPAPEHRSAHHPWAGVEAPDTSEVRGNELMQALKERGLSTAGSADDKRKRLAESLAADTEEN